MHLNQPNPNCAKGFVPGTPGCTQSHLLRFRLEQGLSQLQAAAGANTCLDRYRAAEHGDILNTKVTTLIKIANSLNLGVADIWPILGSRL